MRSIGNLGKFGLAGLVVAGALVSSAVPASASGTTEAVAKPASVEVGWPFDTCDPHDYLFERGPFVRNWLYIFDHWDGANFYKVRDTAGNVVGNGWASCHP